MKTNLTCLPGFCARVVPVVLLSVCFSGCAWVGRRPNDTAALNLRRAANEVNYEEHALGLTMGTLNDLVNRPGADLKIPYRQFSVALDRLVGAANRTDATGRRMAERNAKYLQVWDKDLKTVRYEHIRDVGVARRTEVSSRFDTLNQRYRESQTAMQPLIAYLRDIRRVLSADLTPGGLASIKPIAANARDNSAKVETALADLSDELADSETRLSSLALQQPAQNPAQPRADAATQ
jgi:Protein of unknown function (DUF2959)